MTDAYSGAIGADHDRTMVIGTKYSDPALAEPLQHLIVRMSVRILRAYGNQSEAWRCCIQEPGT